MVPYHCIFKLSCVSFEKHPDQDPNSGVFYKSSAVLQLHMNVLGVTLEERAFFCVNLFILFLLSILCFACFWILCATLGKIV